MAARKREREWGENLSPPLSPDAPAAPPPGQWKSYFPPPTGDIDLEKYDMPASQCALEWWYFNSHVTSKKTGQRFSVFSSFFRQVATMTDEDRASGKAPEFYDACTWAVVDVDSNKYYPDSLLDHRSIDVLVSKIDPDYTGKKINEVEKALLELVRKGRLPLPDRMMTKAAAVSNTHLSIDLGDCKVEKRAATKAPVPVPDFAPKVEYQMVCHNPNKDTHADLKFYPMQGPVRHGAHGVVNDMFYYYIPRCHVSGTVNIKGEVHEVEGSGWYDREFGGSAKEDTSRDALDAWVWFSVQLSDGSNFTLFNIVDQDTQHEKEKVAVWSDANGSRIAITDFSLTYKNLWTSMVTYIEYPLDWKLVVPQINLDLQLNCQFEHQEFNTVLVTGGGFYEGRIVATGSRGGRPVNGTGFLERKNHRGYTDTTGLLKNVGRFVRKTLGKMYPLDGTKEYVDRMVLGIHAPERGVDPKKVCDTLFKPVRMLIDRGGKAWRSLILVSAVNALSDDYVDCSKYIAMSELLHVGSLIIDDIQDDSTVRRGGRCVHLDYGIPTAINAGTGCYFMAPTLAGIDDLEGPMALEMYQLYFDAMRAGHAGQGLDMLGLDHLMPSVVESGDITEVLAALRAIHVFKTGGAAGTMCRMASVFTRQVKAIAELMDFFGTQIGLAFQIVDDALNLKGFEGDLKEIGEDIRDGKITYPVIKGMSRLGRADREYIWSVLKEKTSDQGKISSVISKLNGVGAIDDCLVEARNLVEEAWERIDPILKDSLSKLMMRTFCLYLTERTY